MALVHLTQSICDRAAPSENRYDLRDSVIRGLFMRVEVSGRKTWYLNYRTPAPERKLKNKKIVSAALLSLADARKIAKENLARLFLENVDPAKSINVRQKRSPITLKELIDEYEPWVMSHQKSGDVTLRALRLFHDFRDMPVDKLNTETVEWWQTHNIGRLKRATINRRIAALRAVCSWGVQHELIDDIPFKVPKLAQTDSKNVTRFLSREEHERLMDELERREERSGRDYLKPAVILSLNTGIRKGTLLGLLWSDVNFDAMTVSLRREIMKAGRDAVLPLNGEALRTLKEWKAFSGGEDGGYVFPSENGGRRKDTSRAFQRVVKRAGIKNFTWHCMRHDFASQLAMRGVALHIVQRLMCHGSMAMTQRYAHLSETVLGEAVRRLEA